MTWEIVGAIATVAGTLLGLAALIVAGLERRTRTAGERADQARAAEAEARANEAAAAWRLAERRVDAVIRAVRAGSPVAGEAGAFANAAARPSVRVLRRIPDHGPLRTAVSEVSSALDETRVLGPPSVVEAMESYFDAVLAVFEAASTGERDAITAVQAGAHGVATAKAYLVAAAQAAGIGDAQANDAELESRARTRRRGPGGPTTTA